LMQKAWSASKQSLITIITIDSNLNLMLSSHCAETPIHRLASQHQAPDSKLSIYSTVVLRAFVPTIWFVRRRRRIIILLLFIIYCYLIS
jgi:hypothetical protein